MKDSGTKTFSYCVIRYDDVNLNLTSHNNSVNQTVKREDIEIVNSFYKVYLLKQPINYCFRLAGFGILGFILTGILFFKNIAFWKILIWLSWVLFVGGGMLLFIEIFIDGLLGLNIAYRFFAFFVGHKGYDVIVKNKNGISVLEFFSDENEINEITRFIKSLKKEKKREKQHTIQTLSSNDSFIQIEKLAELHRQGLLTVDEFSQMKKQLLGI
jgi:hypothetical protein